MHTTTSGILRMGILERELTVLLVLEARKVIRKQGPCWTGKVWLRIGYDVANIDRKN